MKRYFYFQPILLVMLLASCQEDEGKTASKPLNPNGDSELALLMRQMFDEGLDVKKAILEGKTPELKTDFVRIHTAKPTEDGKNATPEYISYARAFEDAVTAYQKSTPYQRVDAYQHMVSSCINCHAEVCPGPVRKIRKLELSEKELLSLENK